MFGFSWPDTLSSTMEPAPSDQHVSRTAAQLVFGVDNRIASTVFGALTVMVTVVAYGRGFPERPWRVVLLVATTAVVLWVAHIYAHGLSESISERRRLRGDVLLAIAHRELGILLAAVPPTAALVLGAVGLFTEHTAIWLALGTALAVLAAEGLRYARIERLGTLGTFAAIAVNLGLGLIFVALKVVLLH